MVDLNEHVKDDDIDGYVWTDDNKIYLMYCLIR